VSGRQRARNSGGPHKSHSQPGTLRLYGRPPMADRDTLTYSADGMLVLSCNGDCECHRCCIPYDGEGGPHCEECQPDE
jgi:hypothetical protein